MSAAPADAPGRYLLVEVSADEAEALASLPGEVRVIAAAELDRHVRSCPGGVDVVVVGSRAVTPVGLVQHAHRAAPHAGVVVLTSEASADPVRREIAFAPGVPLDVVVLGRGDPLAARVADLQAGVTTRRRHAAVLAAVAARRPPEPAPQPGAVVALGALLEHAPLGVVVADRDGRMLGWNRRAQALLGLPTTLAGTSLEDVLPGAGALVGAVTGGGDDPGAEARPDEGLARKPLELAAADGLEVEVSAVASQLDDGRPVALLVLVDVTDRRRAERGRDRLAGHVALLARVSESLTSTLDTNEALARLGELLVPGLADWVSIQLADETDRLTVVAMRHRDPAKAPLLQQARQRQAVAASAGAPSRSAVRDNRPLLLPDLAGADLSHYVEDAELRSLFVQLGVGSALAVPLSGRDRVLGSLVLVNMPGSRRLSEEDVTVAAEVGRRAGIALDNARLYAQQRGLATELQRSLLTAPPQPQQGQVVVRYVAAAQEAQVGGDWYDAFLQPDGAAVLVIGDVVGHDTRAAAAMSQLRGVLRGIGFTTNADPAEVLTRVDAAIEGLLIETTATSVVARLEQTGGEREEGVARLAWSNAGHPPPLVVHADGTVLVLDGRQADGPGCDADLLLGVDATTRRRTQRTSLSGGSTVLLYTDGLVERRGQSLDEGIAALVTVLHEAADRPLDELCDTVLSRLLPSDPEDDVALVAVRLHPGHVTRWSAGPAQG